MMKIEITNTIEADVIVLGAGPGGIGAAVTAGRNGVDTIIVERYGGPGGMAVYGEVSPFMLNHLGDKCLDHPVYTDWISKMQEYIPDGDIDPEAVSCRSRTVGVPEAMLAAEDILLEAGVKPLYHHHLFDCEVVNDKIETVYLFSKTGITAAKAKIFIDCTGDADLAAKAGCEIYSGNEKGLCQPMTLCFKIEDIDRKKFDAAGGHNWSKGILNEIYNRGKAAGEIENPRENILLMHWFKDSVIHFNTTRVIKHSAINGMELSDAEVQARKQIRQLFKLFKREAPGFKNARLRSIGIQIGIRESRRVAGREFLDSSSFDFEKGSFPHFDNGIAKVRYPIDIHDPNGGGTTMKDFPEGAFYEIPYGCIVAKDVDNLLIGGRPISVDHVVHSSMRVMPSACSIGQAAGVAASMSINQDIIPAKLNGIKVREKLKKIGAVL